MTRAEQAKRDCAIAVTCDMEYGTPFATTYNKGIEKGVKWADSHPQQKWHKYPDEKPKEDNDYIVYLEDSNHGDLIEIYGYSTKDEGFGYITANGLGPVEWKSIDGCVKAWMEKPELPKFERYGYK